MTSVTLPALSVPVTVNVCEPIVRRVEVRAVGDRADAGGDPGLVVGALELRRHDLVQRIHRTIRRAVMFTDGFTASALNAIRFTTDSTRPASSVARNCTK